MLARTQYMQENETWISLEGFFGEQKLKILASDWRGSWLLFIIQQAPEKFTWRTTVQAFYISNNVSLQANNRGMRYLDLCSAFKLWGSSTSVISTENMPYHHNRKPGKSPDAFHRRAKGRNFTLN